MTYKVNGSLYSLQDLLILVKFNKITVEDFEKITKEKYKKNEAND